MTGVQTCALPISKPAQVITLHPQGISGQPHRSRQTRSRLQRGRPATQHDRRWPRIGRHDCRVPTRDAAHREDRCQLSLGLDRLLRRRSRHSPAGAACSPATTTIWPGISTCCRPSTKRSSTSWSQTTPRRCSDRVHPTIGKLSLYTAIGPGPGQPARVVTGATGRPERDRGSEREPEDWSHGRGHETRGCGSARL